MTVTVAFGTIVESRYNTDNGKAFGLPNLLVPNSFGPFMDEYTCATLSRFPFKRHQHRFYNYSHRSVDLVGRLSDHKLVGNGWPTSGY